MKSGIVKENNGYSLYANGKFIMWCKYLNDLKKSSKQVPVRVIYSTTKTETHMIDYSMYTKK